MGGFPEGPGPFGVRCVSLPHRIISIIHARESIHGADMTNRIRLQPVLSPEEYRQIDAFCSEHRGESALAPLSAFLDENFGLDLVCDPEIVAGFMTDSSNLPGCAAALARPQTARECAVVMRACHKAGITLTVSGGRSNLTGSATPQGGVIMSLQGMLSPDPEVDPASQTVRAPVGIILEDLRKLVLEQTGGALQFPVNPTSRTEADVGGAIACNASGFTPGEVGAIRDWVEMLDVLFPSGFGVTVKRGQILSHEGEFLVEEDGKQVVWPVPRYPRPAIKNAGGPFSSPDGVMDVVDLIVGSEGIFGLITGCTLRLERRPSEYLDIFFSLPSEEHAVAFERYIARALPGGAGSLAALEYFGLNCRKHMDHEERFFHGDDPVAVYVQVPLSDEAVEDAAERWLTILSEADCGIDEDAILLLDNDRDRDLFLKARHSLPANSLEVVHRRGTFTIMTDTVVPPDRFPEFLRFTHDLLRAEGLDYLSFGHLGDCHLHFMMLPEKEQLARATGAYDRIVEKSAELGGVYSGEHGTGKRKRGDFLKCYGRRGEEDVRACKRAVDPDFLLNRDNVIVHA